jgi:hypothetical protein
MGYFFNEIRPHKLDSSCTWESEATKHFWVQEEELVPLFTKRGTDVAHCDSDAVDLWFPSVCDEYYLHRGSFFKLSFGSG